MNKDKIEEVREKVDEYLGLIKPDNLNIAQNAYWDIFHDKLRLGFLLEVIDKEDIEVFLKEFYDTPDNKKIQYLDDLEADIYQKRAENFVKKTYRFEKDLINLFEEIEKNTTPEQYQSFIQNFIYGEDSSFNDQADQIAQQKLANALERRGGFNRPLNPDQIANLAETGKKDVPQDEAYNPSNIRTPNYDRPTKQTKQNYRQPPVRINSNSQRPDPGRGAISNSQTPQYQNNFQRPPRPQPNPKIQPNQNNKFIQNKPKGLDDLLNK